ncbi:MAG TPA: double-strand break repair helicase AddA [Acetobacteraceae bacterium]|nr:double-strand break repair helicase AddA [Acetobacteraceae bacterium]
MTTPRARAEAAQCQASDPAVSAFVAASAGSGKTKLLIDRLLRLMLGGAEPGRILCLTFTKAAAAEMAVRLQRRLGDWVTLPDPDLAAAVRALDVAPDPAVLARARALFARVLDLPGGMRIETIHAFCQSLLRRFPLEAALSPHFELMEDADTGLALDEARETALADAGPALRPAIAALAGLVSAARFQELLAELHRRAAALAPVVALPERARLAALRRVCGCRAADPEALIAGAVAWAEQEALAAAARVVVQSGAPAVAARAQRMLDWLACGVEDRAANWAEWCCEFLTGSGDPRATGAFVNPKLLAQRLDLAEPFAAEQARIAAIQDECRAFDVVAFSAALLALAAPALAGMAAAKERRGLLEYDDLIGRTEHLLREPGAAWVLYKLDGGLDHLLLDEAQDTAPAQWRIAAALTDEFFSGLGAQEKTRTVFAVGDAKQSIYSFQGADHAAFAAARAGLERRVAASGQPWREVTLDVCFRCTAPVLALVDAVFADPAARAGVEDGLRHFADRGDAPGSVELWPLAPPPPEDPPPLWEAPRDYITSRSAKQALADHLALWIAREIDGGAVRAGEVLVLLRRRDAFARALVRRLKANGVSVAGLDRMVLTEQVAVQDLMALGAALLLPEDDLTLAEVLTSPLGFLSDDSLMELAATRTGSLWETLRGRAAERAEWAAAWRFLSALLARVDYATPYGLFAEALGPLGGRARLLARLGPEAAEPVDEMLAAALRFASRHPPSLQGFLHWLGRSAAEIKREPEGAGDAVRVMTVHGAKGLQAKLVILPDTTGLPPDETGPVWADAGEGLCLPLWAPKKEHRCSAVDALRAAARVRCLEEHNRLLYVALTRAEDRLLVCGWQPRKKVDDGSWYAMVGRGMARLASAEAAPFGPWPGERLRLANGAAVATLRTGEPPPAPRLPAWAGAAPDWTAAAPPAEPALPTPLAPSRPEGIEHGPVPAALSPLSREARGMRLRAGAFVHGLLQHLPALPEADRAAAAHAHAARAAAGLPESRALAGQALAVLAHPELAPLFGPGARAEVPLAGVVSGRVVAGMVDRLAVLPDAVLIADYKTGRGAPARVEATPVSYLRQMAAYRAVLRAIHPDRPVRCALVWTQGAKAVVLPDALLDGHAPGAA